MILSPPQKIISNSNARFRVAVCGRRFGKSFLSLNEIAKIARYPNQDIMYIAPTYRMCKQIMFDLAEKEFRRVNWLNKVNLTDMTFLLRNGSKISLRGADNFDSLRGVSNNFVVFDEAAFIDEKAWTEVIRPTLSDRQGSALFISTPTGRNWIYDLHSKGINDPTGQWKSFSFTTIEGGFVTPEEVEQAKQDLNEKVYRQEYEGTFETSGSLVAWAFDREKNVKKCPILSTELLYVGMDFNVTPVTAAIMIKHGEDLYVIDEICMPDSNTTEMVSELLRRYPKSRFNAYPDPAGRQRRSSANGMTDFTILSNAGFTVKAPLAHDPVRDRINALNSRLCNANGVRHLFIESHCKHTLESLEKHLFKEGTQIPDKSGYDHMFDALSYAVAYLFPIRRDIKPEAQQRWGVSIA